MNKENKHSSACALTDAGQDDCRCGQNGQNCINSRFTLSVVAVILSCFTGFWTIPMALAALILSLRTQDLTQANRTEEARRTAWWAGLFGWLTIAFALLPIVLVIFFGGAIVAFLTALLAAA